MKRFFYVLSESWYEDNYEEGQIGPFNETKLESGTKDTLEEVLTWLKNNYGEEYPLEIIEDNQIVCPVAMRTNGHYGFEKATDEEIEQWKAGKINLYSVEYLLKIYKIDPVTEEELASKLNA